MELSGEDTHGNQFSSPLEMWMKEAAETDSMEECDVNHKNVKKEEWYNKGVSYWENVEASVDGVLGGFGHLNSPDVQGSTMFIMDVFGGPLAESKAGKRRLVALDCGAGIGRVTKNFLLNHFHEVDLVEPVSHFLDEARVSLGGPREGGHEGEEEHRAVNFFCTPLQDFTPEPGRYDVIWIQWCIGHLTDADFVKFFRRCQSGLKPGGIVVLKDNTAKEGFVLDKEDSSVTRSHPYFCDLFKKAGFHLRKHTLQRRFPKDLFPVRMYCLVPNNDVGTTANGPQLRPRVANSPGIIH